MKSATQATLLMFSLLGGASSYAAEPIPVRDFFKNPQQANFQISPDGKMVSFTQPFEHRLNIYVQTRGGEPKQVTQVKDRDITQYMWKGNDYLLFLKDNGGDENYHLYAVDKQGSTTRDLTPFDKVRVELIDELEDHPTDVLIGLNKRNPEIFDAYRLNVQTGKLTLVAKNPGKITGWVTDHEGRIRVATSSDGVNTSLLYRKDEKSPFKTVLTTNYTESMEPRLFTFDNKYLYATSNIGRDKSELVVVDPATGKEKEVIYKRADVDVSGVQYSHKRKKLTSVDYIDWKPQRAYLDEETQALYKKLEEKLPGYEVLIGAANKDEDTFVIVAYNDRTRGTRYLYEAKTDQLTKLADVTPWLDEKQMAPMKPIQYTSRDGLTIHGYLTLPLDKEAKNLPVVVNPHGGPWLRDQWGYNPEVQWLANRGYAVLQMNFRGSTGYGKQFWRASFKQWGGTMQDDITDGVNWLVKQGIADPKKICIYGGSYGGYATLAGVTFTPDLYACAVDYVGVSNLFTFLKTIPPYWKQFLDQMHDMVGHPVRDKALLTARSPALHADKIKTPLMVLQGAKDPRVNIAESNQIVDALKKRGVDVQYIVKENEGHGFHNEENRFEAYEAMEKFFGKYLN
ncbi:dipeptidyl aminopeptidase/acylaminoacyl peptidase [Chitinivorax tropicus]|uniref:Dipeptidyl aminopeptidase/acylaminoacyl peptidase n=1 Tax=Chitinivorax tropicus TaxID=714531 RepID=A0A840MRQ6_9PROT|nr:S9 family peptidase [Chitinivorax tropicus]MBB5020105.1 dipeptidyl aminopeptidase/acylaminoacyl peptidase [Chitinivorax tropicus]